MAPDGEKEVDAHKRAPGGMSSTALASRRKSKWSREDDDKIRSFVERHGAHQWSVLAKEMPGRKPKQIRERWVHHLRPDLTKQKPWTKGEERFILNFLVTEGNRWMALAGALPGRYAENCSLQTKL